MKVVFTDEARRDLAEILDRLAIEFPTVSPMLEARLHATLRRIGMWPESAREVAERPGVRVVPLLRYPYNIFFRVTVDAVEVLHIHHSVRR